MIRTPRPVLLVLASTYPRWADDHEPGFVHELARRLTDRFRVLALVPHSPGSSTRETLDGVEVIRYRYAPGRLETLVNDGGIVTFEALTLQLSEEQLARLSAAGQ